MKVKLPIGLFILTTFLITQNAQPIDKNPFLAEASSFSVFVEKVPSELKSIGVTSDSIRDYTELLLRRSSLPVGNIDTSKSNGLVHVQIGTHPIMLHGNTIGYACGINFSFSQPAKTCTTGETKFVKSWEAPFTILTSPQETLNESIRECLKVKVESFENVWLASHKISK